MSIDPELRAAMHLTLAPGLGPATYQKLYAACGSARQALAQTPAALAAIPGVTRARIEGLFAPETARCVELEFERLSSTPFTLLPHWDDRYPEPLRFLPDAPPLLYVWGELRPGDAVALAMVGTRRPSFYGRQQAGRLARELAHAGFTIVSGLARGIDAAAHRGALDGGGRTLAVLGSGLGKLYPREHEALAADIAKSGALLSELPLDTAPEAENFPRRNRLISGLALGVLVVEAARKSGSLITARWAGEQGKEVFALPGQVDKPTAEGTNALIRDGARLVTCADDVLAEFPDLTDALRRIPPTPPPAGHPDDFAPNERKIWELLGSDPLHVDEIAQTLQLPVAQVSSILLVMEMRRLVTQVPGMRFARGSLRS